MGGEHGNGQRADVGGGRDHAQRRGQCRIVLRREERGHEDQIRHAVADRLEGPFCRVGEDQLGADALAHDGGQRIALAAVRFDRENDGHPGFVALHAEHEPEEHDRGDREDHEL